MFVTKKHIAFCGAGRTEDEIVVAIAIDIPQAAGRATTGVIAGARFDGEQGISLQAIVEWLGAAGQYVVGGACCWGNNEIR